MRRASLILVAALAACGPSQEPSEPAATVTASPEAILSASASALPVSEITPPVRDYAPPTLTPEAEKGEKGARNLLLAWADAMEDRAFEAAYRLFGDYAGRAAPSPARYAAAFADYRTVTVAIGEGAVEGACGSSYYEVPITLTGTTTAGETYVREGTMTLRRVNDVDGATPAQLRWHLEKLAWD